MSANHWWLHVAVTQQQVTDLRSRFEEALSAAAESLVPKTWPPADEDRVVLIHFHRAFNLQAVDEFSRAVLFTRGVDLELRDEIMLEWISTPGITPVSILYYALGAESAALLPGMLGNVLLGPDDVPAALERVERALEQGNLDAQARRGAQLYRLDHYPCESEVVQIIEAWPLAMRASLERGSGLLSVGVQAP